MDLFIQGISLGRWFRIKVVLSWFFLLFAGYEIFGGDKQDIPANALLIGLLFGTVLVHEFGHSLACKAVGGEVPLIVLTPFGGAAFAQPPMNPRAAFITTFCGPLVNAVFWPVFYLASKAVIIHQYGAFTWEDIRTIISSADGIVDASALTLPAQICVMMWQINKMLLLFNLIPAYPMDGGRLLQEILWFMVGYGRSLMIAGMVGTVAGAGFIVIGMGLREIDIQALGFHLGTKGHVDPILVGIGLMCCMGSWGIYQRSHEIGSWRKN